MDILYTAEALATGGGRNGHVRTTDGILDTDVRVPKEMGGTGGAPNPELLFAAGYAACFHSALQAVARAQKVAIDGSSVGSPPLNTTPSSKPCRRRNRSRAWTQAPCGAPDLGCRSALWQ